MTAVAATLPRTALGGLTVYVAFLLSHAAHAADGMGRGDPLRGRLAAVPDPISAPAAQVYGAPYAPVSGAPAAGAPSATGSSSYAATSKTPATDRNSSAPSPFAPGYGPQTLDSWSSSQGGTAVRPPVPLPPVGTETPYGPLPPPAPPFRDTPYGAHANPGPPGGPSFLHPNFPAYQTQYGIWYQPRAFWEPVREVYRPQPFRPRGWGNLFVDDPCRKDRMDYNRYVVKDLPSRYGPSYYPLYQPPSECLIRPERHYVPPVWGSAE
jgi:hypothetical protein